MSRSAGSEHGHTRVVHDDVDVVELREHGVAQLLDVLVARDVAVHGQHSRTCSCDLVLGFGEPRVVDVGEHDAARPAPRELERSGAADAARAARDDCDRALDVHQPFGSGCAGSTTMLVGPMRLRKDGSDG